MAAIAAVAEESTRTGIHGGDELERRRKASGSVGARDRHDTAFKGLPQGFERRAPEFREFIEKQNAVMRQRDLTGTRMAAAADERCRRGAMVG